jgi:DNA mismatch repair protein MLH3
VRSDIMSSVSLSIQPLPDHVRSQITSTIEIRSLLDVVERLFRNSLDANARVVRIQIDFGKGHCSVTDDGDGIEATEFQPGSFLAHEHCTSRRSEAGCYGKHGQALASIAALSLLSITSSQRDQVAHTTTLCYGKRLSSGPASSDVRSDRHSSGTKVVVHNLFGNFPVRFKAQALACSNAGEIERQYRRLERRITAYILAGFSYVSIHLEARGRSLSYHHKPDTLQRSRQYFTSGWIHQILYQTGFYQGSDASSWRIASAKAGEVSIRLAVLTRPLPSRQCQFITFGRTPVHADGPGKALFDMINDILQTSGFEHDTVADDAKWGQLSGEGSSRHPDTKQRQNSSERVDRWPGFYIRIDRHDGRAACAGLPNGAEFDNGSEMQHILALLRLLLKRCLGRNRSTASQDVSHALARESSNLPKVELFNCFRRTKSAFPTADIGLADGLPFIRDTLPSKTKAFEADVELLLADIEMDKDPLEWSTSTGCGVESISQSPGLEEENISDTLSWTNPKTGKLVRFNDNSFVVNAASDDVPISEPEHSCCDHELRKSQRRWQQPAIDRQALAQRLKQWPSQTFASKTHSLHDTTQFDGEEPPRQLLSDQELVDEELVAQDVANARVLRQVDQKFILVTAREASPTGALVVLVDQHAADERIKVEQLYRELCAAQTVPLAKPIHIDIDNRELELLESARPRFSRWGLLYQRSQISETVLRITHLPQLIAERCRQEPKVLIDLIREEIWAEHTTRPRVTTNPGASLLDQIADCPRGLVEMINSRACRSAIMFNDVLNINQCKILLNDLSKCILPFQCAHGRPSLTVLTRIGSLGFGTALDAGESLFRDTFENWI